MGKGYSTINTARCALSTIICNDVGLTIGKFSSVKRLVKGVFELRPPLPRYTFIWDANIVLDYLKNFHPIQDMPLSYVTYKLVMLLALCTAQRVQTLHAINVRNIEISSSLVIIPITKLLKQSNARNHKFTLCIKPYMIDRSLCPVDTLKEYLKRTHCLRKGETQLFLSFHKPHLPVSKETISRWIKSILEEAGIDVAIFKPHSTRAASCSNLKRNEVPVDDIVRTAGWCSNRTFKTFYDKTIIAD